MSDKIGLKDAQAEINGLLVAEICRDFGINFRNVYPEHILARGVGPEQAFIGLAIKRGHLALPTVQPQAQCCMCGKTGLDTTEHGGPGAQLSDKRWTCSRGCYDVAVDMMPGTLPAVQPDAAAIREAALREAAAAAWAVEGGDRWTRSAAQSAILNLIGDKNANA